MKKKIALSIAGGAYGVMLSLLGILATGAGHGTSALLEIGSAPIGVFNFVLGMFFAPLMWAVIGFIVGNGNRTLLVAIMSIHYASIALAPSFHSAEDQEYLARTSAHNPGFMIFFVAFYLCGQAALWICWFRFGREKSLP
jgi:hypothetical protein